MFGYVKPYTPELKMREHEAYRGLYCGLCRAMGRVTGQTSRLTLNYEFVFLAAVRMLLIGEAPEYTAGRCAVHPVRKRAIATPSPELDYAAAVAAMLGRSKVKDDVTDERGLKKLTAVLLTPYFAGASMRGAKHLGDPAEECAEVTSQALTLLRCLEKENTDSIDRCADAFGGITEHIFSAGLEGSAARIAREIGKSTGRFIYLADALDDLPSDAERCCFNPILSLYGDGAVVKHEKRTYISREVAEAVMTGALCDLGRLGAAVELACGGGDRTLEEIVKNTAYLGMPRVLEEIAAKRAEK